MNKFRAYYALRWQIFERDNFTCQYCGQYAPNVKLELDHVIPKEDGGTDEPDNLKTSCYACNRGKSGLRIQQKRQGNHFPVTSETWEHLFDYLMKIGQKEFTPQEIATALNITPNYARVLINRQLTKELLVHISGNTYKALFTIIKKSYSYNAKTKKKSASFTFDAEFTEAYMKAHPPKYKSERVDSLKTS